MARLGFALAFLFVLFAAPAFASLDTNFTRDFQTAAYETYSFSTGKTASFYKNTDDRGYGFRLGGVLDSTDAAPTLSSGLSDSASGSADLEHNSKLTTLFVSGTLDLPGRSDALLRPYLLGGVGVAVYDTSAANLAPDARGMDVIPVFKLGGGLAMRMGEEMDLTFSYKAGFASPVGALSASRQDAAMQMVDVALKYKF